ncbi:MAG TPA: hypothetical protein VG096_06585 [Bryobacteraceae bacterium]|jgi:hypothetical protein|nr:hypothetical protein [Bryobacteraceae bacterium]
MPPLAHSRRTQFWRHTGRDRTGFGSHVTRDLFDIDLAKDKYTEVVDKLKSEWRIVSAPLSSLPLDHFFQMAIEKMLPFEERGIGFQDAVILFSAIEDLKRFSGESGILLSNDKVFCEDRTRDLIASFLVDLKVFKSVDDFLVILKSNLDDYLRQEWDEDERIAAAELYRQKDAIEKFIRESINQEPRLLAQYVPDEDIVVTRVELQDVTAVFVPQPPLSENRTEQQPVRIAAAIRCLIRVNFPKPIIHKILRPPQSLVIPIELEVDAIRAERRYIISEYIRATPPYEPDV